MQSIAPEDVGIFEARVLPASGGFHFEVVLDGLADPRGAVSLAQCESFSRNLAHYLDERILAAEDSSAPGDVELPAGLTVENYTIEVSSAGAERRLRLPEDLERFKGQPIRLKLPVRTEDGKETVSVRLVVFDGRQADDWCFREYLATSTRASRVRRRREKREARKAAKDPQAAGNQSGDELLRLGPQELADPKLKANLYLDY